MGGQTSRRQVPSSFHQHQSSSLIIDSIDVGSRLAVHTGENPIISRIINMKTSRRGGTTTYPYPRTHTTLMLCPSSTGNPVDLLSPNNSPNDNSTIVYRPPLNRAIPTIPESKSNESIQTHMSTSDSRHSITPTNAVSIIKFAQPSLPLEQNNDQIRYETDTSLVIENRMLFGNNNNNNSSIQQPRSPLLAVANNVRHRLSKFGARFSNTGTTQISGSRLSLRSSASLSSMRRTNSADRTNKSQQPDMNANFVSEHRLFKSSSMEVSVDNAPSSASHYSLVPSILSSIPKKHHIPDRPTLIPAQKKTGNKQKSTKMTSMIPSLIPKSTSKSRDNKLKNNELVNSKMLRPKAMTANAANSIKNPVLPTFAPLAESESSRVENSPAIEMPPSKFPTIIGQKSVSPPMFQRRRYDPNKCSPLAVVSTTSSSYIDNSDNTKQCNRLITTIDDEVGSKLTKSNVETCRRLIDDEIRDQPMLVGTEYNQQQVIHQSRNHASVNENESMIDNVQMSKDVDHRNESTPSVQFQSEIVQLCMSTHQCLHATTNGKHHHQQRRSAGDGIERESTELSSITAGTSAIVVDGITSSPVGKLRTSMLPDKCGADLDDLLASAVLELNVMKTLLPQLQTALQVEEEITNAITAQLDESNRKNAQLQSQLDERDRMIAERDNMIIELQRRLHQQQIK